MLLHDLYRLQIGKPFLKIHHPDFINTEKEMGSQKHIRKKWVLPRASAEKS